MTLFLRQMVEIIQLIMAEKVALAQTKYASVKESIKLFQAKENWEYFDAFMDDSFQSFMLTLYWIENPKAMTSIRFLTQKLKERHDAARHDVLHVISFLVYQLLLISIQRGQSQEVHDLLNSFFSLPFEVDDTRDISGLINLQDKNDFRPVVLSSEEAKRIKPVLNDVLRRSEYYTMAELKAFLLYLNYFTYDEILAYLKHAGISSSRYYTFVNGQGDITVHKLHAMLRTLNVGLDELCLFIEPKPVDDEATSPVIAAIAEYQRKMLVCL
ncbi:hypothetical protein H7R52_04510 [Weissella confusa]|uniref:Uncharacterized protein n=1 Tax=Weissella confusa TaxID=1583 RepID=A0A923SMY6_WEICO|nr:hypothetical protein [Weissella confusa]